MSISESRIKNRVMKRVKGRPEPRYKVITCAVPGNHSRNNVIWGILKKYFR